MMSILSGFEFLRLSFPFLGHTRNLLEVGSGALVPSTLEALETVEDDMLSPEVETPLVQALTDHDYTPAPKRQRTFSKMAGGYYVPPLDEHPPRLGKTDSGGGGFPPDDSSGTEIGAKIAAKILDAVAEHTSNHSLDPGGKAGGPQAVVVNLVAKGRKRMRDDLELEW